MLSPPPLPPSLPPLLPALLFQPAATSASRCTFSRLERARCVATRPPTRRPSTRAASGPWWAMRARTAGGDSRWQAPSGPNPSTIRSGFGISFARCVAYHTKTRATERERTEGGAGRGVRGGRGGRGAPKLPKEREGVRGGPSQVPRAKTQACFTRCTGYFRRSRRSCWIVPWRWICTASRPRSSAHPCLRMTSVPRSQTRGIGSRGATRVRRA